MRKFLSIDQIATGCGGELIGAVGGGECGGVCIDSRGVSLGDCFFAIKGENFDGHKFVVQAFAGGACCAVVDGSFDADVSGGAIIKVADTTEALGRLAAYYRDILTAKVVAITGSVGKTSTRDIIAQILSARYKCHAAKKSFNNHIGMPLTILEADIDSEVLILELGTNHPGEIEYLTKIARPDIALITKVAAAHIEFFGSVTSIAKEKASIAFGLKPGGLLIVNGDSPELLSYLDDNSIIYMPYHIMDDYRLNGDSGEIMIDGKWVAVPLAGRGNLENAMAAYKLCRELGFTVDDFERAVAEIEAPQMRLNIVEAGGLTIINDCYNANPQSMANAVEVLAGFDSSDRRTVAVCGDMLELGTGGQAHHQELGRVIAVSGIDIVIAVGRYSLAVVDAANREATRIGSDIETHTFNDTAHLCEQIKDILADGDVVLFKASRSIALEKAVKLLTANC